MTLRDVHPDWRDELLGLIVTGFLMGGLFILRTCLPSDQFGVIFILNVYFYAGIAVGIAIVLAGFLLKKFMIPVTAAAVSVVLWMIFPTIQPAGSIVMGIAFVCCIASFPFIARLIALIPTNKRRKTNEN